MSKAATFLFEIGLEELPSKILQSLSNNFAKLMQQEFNKFNFNIEDEQLKVFASPRRIAVQIKACPVKAEDQETLRKGPLVAQAFDGEGVPTPAAEGFAKRFNLDAHELQQMDTPKGKALAYLERQSGLTLKAAIQDVVDNAIKQLPLPKRMRWGSNSPTFVRPVHWICCVHGNDTIDVSAFNITSSNKSYGHRYLAPKAINVKADNYQKQLHDTGKVIADFSERKQKILAELKAHAIKLKAELYLKDELLDEVTGIVEWPTTMLGEFSQDFLTVPREALISAITYHQKCFPLLDNAGNLMPFFLLVANMPGSEAQNIIKGNQRVMTARLSDAKFFFDQDQKTKLSERVEQLKPILFQAKLGSMYDKSQRVASLAKHIAEQLNLDGETAHKAGMLAKADLCSDMVGEFPELQGIMGDYYARADQMSPAIANAIRESYMPISAKGELPESKVGAVVAIADKLDTIVANFGINNIPKGDKDPFALRRAALGLLRNIIEKNFDLDLNELIDFNKQLFTEFNIVEAINEPIINFCLERLRYWYLDQGYSANAANAVIAKQPSKPLDFHNRITAIKSFQQRPEAETIAEINKRLKNIIDSAGLNGSAKVNDALLQLDDEINLQQLINEKHELVDPLFSNGDYAKALAALTDMQPAIDRFFDNVMVMVEDQNIKTNRIALLTRVHNLFSHTADLSKL